jgi:hypothetical protein
MQALHPGPASQNGFHLTSHRQLDTDEIQSHVRSVILTSFFKLQACAGHYKMKSLLFQKSQYQYKNNSVKICW